MMKITVQNDIFKLELEQYIARNGKAYNINEMKIAVIGKPNQGKIVLKQGCMSLQDLKMLNIL